METLIDCLLYLGTERRERCGTVEMIMAALQKLSLKLTIRKKMIQRGIVEWLIDYISYSSSGWCNRILQLKVQYFAEMSSSKHQEPLQTALLFGSISCNVSMEHCTESGQISYGLEYSTALFMNLCLHRSGKEKCLPMAKPALQALERLLDANAAQILPYLYGALFSLVGHVQGLEKTVTLNLI